MDSNTIANCDSTFFVTSKYFNKKTRSFFGNKNDCINYFNFLVTKHYNDDNGTNKIFFAEIYGHHLDPQRFIDIYSVKHGFVWKKQTLIGSDEDIDTYKLIDITD